MPSDAGMHSVASSHPMGNNFDVNTGTYSGAHGGEAAGASVTGPKGNTYAAGAAEGPRGGVAAGEGVEGAGGGYAARGAAVGPDGRAAAGSTIGGPGGASASRGAAVGPNGAIAGSSVTGRYGNTASRGFAYASPSGQYANAAAVRTNFHGYGMYNANWYSGHPGAWYAAGWASGAAWTAATWPAVGGWFGYGDISPPISYDYGTNVTYEGDTVYVNGQTAGSSDQYYQQAQTLANTGAQAQPADDAQWMPLGVFAVTQSGQTTPIGSIQLAVDKAADVRGNYTDKATNQTQQVKGSVDKQAQRVAFTIGDNSDMVIEVGLYNLTKDEATALVHEGKDNTEQWQLGARHTTG